MTRTLLLALALPFAACGNDVSDDTLGDAEPAPSEAETPTAGLLATDAYARAAPAGGVSAAYIVIENGTADADTLISAQTAAAGRVEIHRTQDVGDGLSGMVPVEGGLPMAAGETIMMQPGGLHVMLLDLQQDLVEGDTLDVTLDFSSGTSRDVRAPIRAISE